MTKPSIALSELVEKGADTPLQKACARHAHQPAQPRHRLRGALHINPGVLHRDSLAK